MNDLFSAPTNRHEFRFSFLRASDKASRLRPSTCPSLTARNKPAAKSRILFHDPRELVQIERCADWWVVRLFLHQEKRRIRRVAHTVQRGSILLLMRAYREGNIISHNTKATHTRTPQDTHRFQRKRQHAMVKRKTLTDPHAFVDPWLQTSSHHWTNRKCSIKDNSNQPLVRIFCGECCENLQIQIGVATQGGAEALAIFHQLLHDEWMTGSLSGPLARIKVDEENCFGMTEWQAVREAASRFLPKHTEAAARKHLKLSHVEQEGLSPMPKDCGAEQGDVHDPLECSLALRSVAAETRGSIAARQAAGTLPWDGVNDPAEEQSLQTHHAARLQESANFQLGVPEKLTVAHDPQHALQKSGGLTDQRYMDDGAILCHPIGRAAFSARTSTSPTPGSEQSGTH